GFALCEVLRQDSVTRGVPILMVTADKQATVVDRRRRAGADAVMIKPTSPEALLKEIHRLLDTSGMQRDPSRDAAPNGSIAQRRRSQSKADARSATTAPPAPPPELYCPSCDGKLTYERSHIGGVS